MDKLFENQLEFMVLKIVRNNILAAMKYIRFMHTLHIIK